VIKLLSSEAHPLYHWQVFLTQRNLTYMNRKIDQSNNFFLSFAFFQKESFMMMLTML